jgi:hypothetical protein
MFLKNFRLFIRTFWIGLLWVLGTCSPKNSGSGSLPKPSPGKPTSPAPQGTPMVVGSPIPNQTLPPLFQSNQKDPVFKGELSELQGQCPNTPKLALEVFETPNTQPGSWGALAAWLSWIVYRSTFDETLASLKRFDFEDVVLLDFAQDGLYGFVARGKKANVISFRGSTTTLDWVNNFNFTTAPADKIGLNGWMHSGFGRILSSNFSKVTDAMQKLQLDPAKPLMVTGHSLGGAIATLVASKLKREGRWNPFLMTFGQPRVGDHSLTPQISELLNSGYYRFFRSDDPVSRVPPPPDAASAFEGQLFLTPFLIRAMHYAHAGIPMEIKPTGEVARVEPWQESLDQAFWSKVQPSDLRQLGQFLNASNFAGHNILNYVCGLLSLASK